LVQNGTASLTVLLEKLASKNKDDRRVAAERLGRLGDARAIEPLIYASGRGGGERAKSAAITALAKIGKPAIPLLIETILHDRTSKFRRASAAAALGLIGDRRATLPLLRATKDPSIDVRLHAIVALARFRESAAIPYLIRALSDESGGVRLQATRTLGLLQSKKAVGPLITALRDEKWYVRQHAARSLGLIGDKRATSPLSSSLMDPRPAVAADAKRALERLRARQ
jgi:HEAT repeat protein